MSLKIVGSTKTALLFGSDTKVGSRCLELLLASDIYSKVILFEPERTDFFHKKIEVHLIDYENIFAAQDYIKGDDLYCCLGTKINLPNSGKDVIEVNSKYSYEIAQIAAANRINQFMFLSSAGANSNALFFFNKFKGQLEEIVKTLDFWSVHIFKPSFILEDSPQNNIGETLALRLGKFLDRLTDGFVSKYRPIEAHIVAKAMINMAQLPNKNGIHIYETPDIEGIINKNRLT